MKNILSIILICFLINTVNAQNIYNSSGRKVAKKPTKKSGFDIDKLVVGGDFRLSAGQGVNLGIAPMLGYKIFDNFYGGVRIGLNYSSFIARFNGTLPNGTNRFAFKSTDYSGSIWMRYVFLQNFYAHLEAEFNSYKAWSDQVWDYDKNEFYNERLSAPSILVGVGMRQPINDRVSLNATILYDLLQDPLSYYYLRGGIDYRIGVLVGF
jgi:hypothetical protein